MNLSNLANAELAIMKLLWKQDSLTARHIRDELYPDAGKEQHGTIQKLLKRLEDKGFINRDRALSTHLFSFLVSADDYASNQLEMLADKLTGGSLAPLITNLVQTKRISQEDIEQLRKMLNSDQDEGGDA